MANTTISPNMNLPVPTVSVDPGPDWANNINSCLGIVDQHNHSAGSGVQITPSGIDINSDLLFNSNNLTLVRSVRFQPQSAALSGASDLGCLYEAGVDLYYNDGAGNQIRITQSGSVAGASGTITGLPSGTASASYSGGTFVFQSATNTSAVIDGGSVIIRDDTASSNGVTIAAPSALAANYTVTLPAGTPASTLPISMDSSGNLSVAQLTLAQLAAAVQQALDPSGSVIAFAGAAAPTGYLLCDGSAVSRSTYSALFSAIGTSCGLGNGTTTFNIPDYRGYFLRGVTGTTSNDPDASARTAMNSGGNTGNNVGSIQAGAFASHNHTQSNNTGGGGGLLVGTGQTGSGMQPNGVTYNTGGDETRPINAYVNYCIKT